MVDALNAALIVDTNGGAGQIAIVLERAGAASDRFPMSRAVASASGESLIERLGAVSAGKRVIFGFLGCTAAGLFLLILGLVWPGSEGAAKPEMTVVPGVLALLGAAGGGLLARWRGTASDIPAGIGSGAVAGVMAAALVVAIGRVVTAVAGDGFGVGGVGGDRAGTRRDFHLAGAELGAGESKRLNGVFLALLATVTLGQAANDDVFVVVRWTDESALPNIQIDFEVKRADGTPLLDATKADFRVTEYDAECTILAFEAPLRSRSGRRRSSWWSTGAGAWGTIRGAQGAVGSFLAGLPEGSRVAVIAFGSDVELACRFTTDRKARKASISPTQPAGRDSLMRLRRP